MQRHLAPKPVGLRDRANSKSGWHPYPKYYVIVFFRGVGWYLQVKRICYGLNKRFQQMDSIQVASWNWENEMFLLVLVCFG